jgi:hypothetical protein
VALDQLDEVAGGVEDEADRHGPPLHPLDLGVHGGPRRQRPVPRVGDVGGVDVELPERRARGVGGVDLLLGELEPRADAGVRHDRLVGVGDLGAAGAGEPQRLVEGDRSLQVGDVEAVLPDGAGHE